MDRKQSGVRRFRASERGNVALMFALSLFPMLAASGAAIDYSRVSAARVRLQNVLDASVLAAAKDVAVVDPSALRARVETFVRANTDGAFTGPVVVTLRSSGVSDLSALANGCVKLFFKKVTGAVADPCVTVRTDAQRPTQNYLEVALVLDNSGSMSGAKIDAAKDAAKSFVENLFAGSSDPQKVKISVVPFTLTVNAGSGMNTSTDPAIDRFGQSSIHWENLMPGNAAPSGVQSRLTLFRQLGETWGGCFEMRPGAWGLNDAPPSPTLGDSLFVPMFAPDEPGPRNTGGSFGSVSYVRQNTLNLNGSSNIYHIRNSYLNDDGSATLSYSGGVESSSTQPACTPLASAYALPNGAATANWQSANWLHRSRANICRYNLVDTPGGATSARKTIASTSGSNGANRGPNFGCNAKPLQRLSTNKSAILATINAMAADGNTNILEGLMWGWRTISPNAPYGDGRSYTWDGGLIRNRKFIILMTDGDNYWGGASNPNLSIYSPFGYFRNNRLGAGVTTEEEATTRMNDRTRTACSNVKALRDVANNEAIKIITVGFSTPGQEISAAGLALLQDCASTDGAQKLYYKATNASELNQVFALIASNIGKLKLTQ